MWLIIKGWMYNSILELFKKINIKNMKSEKIKERNRYITDQLDGTNVLELSIKFGIPVNQVRRIESKISSHPTYDINGGVIDKKHHLVHTHEWWIN